MSTFSTAFMSMSDWEGSQWILSTGSAQATQVRHHATRAPVATTTTTTTTTITTTTTTTTTATTTTSGSSSDPAAIATCHKPRTENDSHIFSFLSFSLLSLFCQMRTEFTLPAGKITRARAYFAMPGYGTMRINGMAVDGVAGTR
jgi:hypothetical protein